MCIDPTCPRFGPAPEEMCHGHAMGELSCRFTTPSVQRVTMPCPHGSIWCEECFPTARHIIPAERDFLRALAKAYVRDDDRRKLGDPPTARYLPDPLVDAARRVVEEAKP